jgi:heat shock protein HslJ
MNAPTSHRFFRVLLAPALFALVSACAATAGGDAPPLRGTVWQLGADGPRAAHIRLDDKQLRFAGYGGCNQLLGRYSIEGPRLRFEEIGASRRACVDDDGSEDRFIAALGGVRAWRIEGGRLKLLSDGGSTLLDLRPGPARP